MLLTAMKQEIHTCPLIQMIPGATFSKRQPPVYFMTTVLYLVCLLVRTICRLLKRDFYRVVIDGKLGIVDKDAAGDEANPCLLIHIARPFDIPHNYIYIRPAYHVYIPKHKNHDKKCAIWLNNFTDDNRQ